MKLMDDSEKPATEAPENDDDIWAKVNAIIGNTASDAQAQEPEKPEQEKVPEKKPEKEKVKLNKLLN